MDVDENPKKEHGNLITDDENDENDERLQAGDRAATF